MSGVRVVEAGTFVAAPSAGMALCQLGAEVIRVDPPGGGSDIARWPLAATGASLFWANLNKGKRSVAVDHRSAEGRELLLALATAPGSGNGVFVDNMVGRHRLRYDELQARRSDVVHVHIQGRNDGSPAVDYTINAEVGVPQMTGPMETEVPVNHVVPTWDLLTGMNAATAVLAGLHRRATAGLGSQVELALGDVALAGVGSMGWLAEAEAAGAARARQGNHMFGCFGVDFESADGRRVMVVALTGHQWRALRSVTDTAAVFSALEKVLGVDLDLESDRYELRETIAAVLRPWFGRRTFAELSDLLSKAQVLWSPYIDMAEAARRARADEHSVAREVAQPGVGPMLATGRPARWDGHAAGPVPAPTLGADTEAVLADVLGLDQAEIGRLNDAGVVAADGPSERGSATRRGVLR